MFDAEQQVKWGDDDGAFNTLEENYKQAESIEDLLPIQMVGKVGRMVGLYDKLKDITDLVEVVKKSSNGADNEPFRVITTIQKKINFIIMHGERLICDDWVYLKKAGSYEIV